MVIPYYIYGFAGWELVKQVDKETSRRVNKEICFL